MGSMWKATIRGVIARKVRLALTALSVVLGVTFVTGTYVLTDTLKHSFDTVFSQLAVNVDAVVQSKAAFGGGEGDRARIPESALAAVRAVPGARAAEGVVSGPAQFVEKDGKTAVQNGGAPTRGISWGSDDRVGPLRVEHGRRPMRDGEVAMDAGTARKHGFKIGDTVKVLLTGPAEQYRLVGTFGFGDAFDLGAVSFAAFDTKTAQRVFDSPGAYSWVYVAAAPGISPDRLAASLRRALAPRFEVLSGGQFADDTGKPVREGLGFLNDALLGFAAVGLFVGAFIIINTFTILISQRTRELGLLRAMGASGRQVLTSVIGEAAVVGAFASAIGLVLGVALGHALPGLLHRFGAELPPSTVIVLPRTIIVSAMIGLGVTVLSAVYPALRAARIPPVAAIADLRPGSATPLRRRAVVGVAIMIVGLGVVAYGLVGRFVEVTDKIEVAGGGALLTFVGVATLSPLWTGPLSRLVGAPLPPTLGMPGTLARRNAMRNPRRTAATASALVIGLSLVCLVAIFAASAKASVRAALGSGVRSDFILTAQQFSDFSPEVARRLRSEPDVAAAVGLRFGDVRIGDNTEPVTGADPDGLDAVVRLDYVAGGSAGLAEGGLLLHEDEAKGYHVHVGDELVVQFPRSGFQPLPVVGIYRHRQFTGGIPVPFVVSQRTYESGFGGTQQDTFVYVKARPGRIAAARHEMRQVLRDFPNVDARTPDAFRALQEQSINQFLGVMIGLLLLSEVIAVLGIVNTLALSVFERTRELGLLRVVGMSRRQVRSMVRGESVIIAVIGGVVGLAVGMFWGWAMTAALHAQGLVRFRVPSAQLALFVVASAVAGIVAAVLPAWRASRLDVLEAIAAE